MSKLFIIIKKMEIDDIVYIKSEHKIADALTKIRS